MGEKKDTQMTPIATVIIPYIEGVSYCIKRTLTKRGIQTVFRTVQMLGCLLMKVKPTLTDLDKKGVIYQVPCRDCSKVYIGETATKLNTRLSEHKQHCRLLQPSKSAVAEHAIVEDHNIRL